jgi:magnesium-protoporphyrin IX monomethyl ester (oxidative) cyclase
MTGSYSNALRLAEKAKRAGAYVVMGGYHPTALPEEVLSSSWVDAVIRGEGILSLRVRQGKYRGSPLRRMALCFMFLTGLWLRIWMISPSRGGS